MSQRSRFRQIVPIVQTALALVCGGWGVWLRNSVLSRPFWGDLTGWDSTARFHVWPWPLKFVTVLNMPAFLAGGLVSVLLNLAWPNLREWASYLLILPLVAFLWHWIGLWLDQRLSSDRSRYTAVLSFVVICAIAASVPENIGGHVSFVLLGIMIWFLALWGAGRIRPDIAAMESSGRSWKVLDKTRFLLALMEELAGNAHVSFEGDLANLKLLNLAGVSQEPTDILRRNTLRPKLDFAIVPLETHTSKSIIAAIGGTIPRAIIHIQIEKNGVLQFGAYDNFHPECISFGPAVTPQIIDSLVGQKLIRPFTERRPSRPLPRSV
jgi:hypothetical protein